VTRPVRALVGAQVVSSLGSLMTAVALPWFVLESTGSAAKMSLVLAAESAPLLLLGVPSARFVARHGPWRTLVACDTVWVLATAAIPVLHALGVLSLPLLAALAFVSGVPWAAASGSQSAMVAGLLGDDVRRVAGVKALLQTLTRLTYFVGPAIGGLVLAAFGAPAVLWLDAASFLVSLVIVAFAVPPVGAVAADTGSRHAGWRFLRRDGWMRPVTAAQALSQGAFTAMTAAIPALAFSGHDRDAALAGALLALWGGGAMLGSLLALRLVRTASLPGLGAIAWAWQAAPLWAIATSHSAVVAAVALGASGLANGVRVPPISALTLQRVPQRICAETMTAASSVILGTGFVGLLAAGPLLEHADPSLAWVGLAAVQSVAALLFARSALLTGPEGPLPSWPAG
jgi:predicted MFS family arabinose efflux permease